MGSTYQLGRRGTEFQELLSRDHGSVDRLEREGEREGVRERVVSVEWRVVSGRARGGVAARKGCFVVVCFIVP